MGPPAPWSSTTPTGPMISRKASRDQSHHIVSQELWVRNVTKYYGHSISFRFLCKIRPRLCSALRRRCIGPDVTLLSRRRSQSAACRRGEALVLRLRSRSFELTLSINRRIHSIAASFHLGLAPSGHRYPYSRLPRHRQSPSPRPIQRIPARPSARKAHDTRSPRDDGHAPALRLLLVRLFVAHERVSQAVLLPLLSPLLSRPRRCQAAADARATNTKVTESSQRSPTTSLGEAAPRVYRQ
jgi:hypothetical protein